MKNPLLLVFTSLLIAAPTWAPAQADVEVMKQIEATKSVISEYVTVRRDIARVQSDWQSYQESANRRIDLYEREVARLREQIERAEADTTQAEREIARVRAEIATLRSANDIILRALPPIEDRVRELNQYFPKPLKTKIDRLMPQLGKGRQASDRMAIVIGILNEVDKFNSEFTYATEDKRLPNGEIRIVDVIYMGLAIGYYADKEGTIGGTLTPAAGGWTTNENTAIAAAVRDAVRFYNNDVKPAELVNLPFAIQSIKIGQ
jgi:hypothetical protein